MHLSIPKWQWQASLVPITLILLVTAAFGTYGLRATPYWYDEWWSISKVGGAFYAHRSPAEIVNGVINEEPRELDPPAYYFLLSYWGALTGWSELAVRALSLLMGVIGIAVVYRLARDLNSARAGLYAALALASSAFFGFYLHDARMYTQVVMLGGLALLLYLRLLHGKVTPLKLLALYAVLVGLLYTHYVAGLLALMLGVFHLTVRPLNRRWLLILLVLGAAGLTFLPWLGIAFGAVSSLAADPARPFATPNTVGVASDLLYLFSNGSIALVVVFGLNALLLRKRGVRMIWVVALGMLILALLLDRRLHFLSNTRYLIALFPPLALIMGIGAARLKPAPILISIWVVAGIWITFNPAYFTNAWVTFLPWDKLTNELRSIAQPNDKLIFLNPDGTPDWISAPVGRYYLHDVAIDPDVLDSLPDKTPDEYDKQLRDFVDDAPLFWIAFDPAHRHSVFAQSAVERFVNEQYLACEPSIHTPDVTLQLYAHTTDAPLDYHFETGSISGEIALGGLQPFPTSTGSTLRFLLHAAVDPSVTISDYSIALHVEDSAGQLVAQTDFGLTQGCYAAEISHLPPGVYHALLTVYRWQTGERLPGTNPTSGDQGDRLLLGEFTVTG